MIPQKYNFYILTNHSTILYINRVYDSETGVLTNANNVTSTEKISTQDIYRCVKLTSGVVSLSTRIFLFDKKGKLMYYNDYSPRYTGLIVLTEDVKSVSFSFFFPQQIDKLPNNEIVYRGIKASPHYKKLSKKYVKESGQYFFRTQLDGSVTLFSNNYRFVVDSSIENKFIFIVEKLNNSTNEYYKYFEGTFNKTDCKFNNSKNSCELKISPLDTYNDILDKYDSTYDLIKLKPNLSRVSLNKRSLMQVYIRGANSISNFFGGTYWEDDVNTAIDSHDELLSKYYFSYIMAGNEFYVKNAGITAVNGVYAGTNGYWYQWNGHTCYLEIIPGQSKYKVKIKRNSDNVELYISQESYVVGDVNNKYLDRNDIIMVNKTNANDKFTIESPFVYHIYRRLLCDVLQVPDSQGVKNTYKLPSDDFVSDNRNYRRCIGLKGGMFFCTSRTTEEPTRFGLNDYNEYFTNKFIPSESGLGRPLPISRNVWANASLWFVYDDQYEYFEENLRKQYIANDMYEIGDIIKILLNKIAPYIVFDKTEDYSKFLYAAKNPITNDDFNILMTQKTNILKGEYDQPAQKAEISFESIMKLLKDAFRCYWLIDNNKLRIEHISWFMNGGSYNESGVSQLDLTKLFDMLNKHPALFYQNQIEYDKSELSSRYEFNFMDDSTELFSGLVVDVKSNYIQNDKTEDITLSNFTSDIDYMLFNPSDFSNDGFALICATKKSNILYDVPIKKVSLVDEDNTSYSAIVQNWYASWLYLINFYMYDMPAMFIKYNTLPDGILYVRGIKKCLIQDIIFQYENDPELFKTITTDVGNGEINELSIDIESRSVKASLMYTPV